MLLILLFNRAGFPLHWKKQLLCLSIKRGMSKTTGQYLFYLLLAKTNSWPLNELCPTFQHSTHHSLLQPPVHRGCSPKFHQRRQTLPVLHSVFVDFFKALDCVNDKIRLSKLASYGIRGPANDLLCGHVADRTQVIGYDGRLSPITLLSIGKPQGSILGHLLLLTCINNFPNHIPHSDTFLYADDTGQNREELMGRLQVHLDITIWN